MGKKNFFFVSIFLFFLALPLAGAVLSSLSDEFSAANASLWRKNASVQYSFNSGFFSGLEYNHTYADMGNSNAFLTSAGNLSLLSGNDYYFNTSIMQTSHAEWFASVFLIGFNIDVNGTMPHFFNFSGLAILGNCGLGYTLTYVNSTTESVVGCHFGNTLYNVSMFLNGTDCNITPIFQGVWLSNISYKDCGLWNNNSITVGMFSDNSILRMNVDFIKVTNATAFTGSGANWTNMTSVTLVPNTTVLNSSPLIQGFCNASSSNSTANLTYNIELYRNQAPLNVSLVRENYNNGVGAISGLIYGSGWKGQRITPSQNYYISMISVRLKRTGTPHLFNVSVRMSDQNGATGSDLVYGTFDGADISTSGYAYYNISLNQSLLLTGGTNYELVFGYPAGDPAAYLEISEDTLTNGGYSASGNFGTDWFRLDFVNSYEVYGGVQFPYLPKSAVQGSQVNVYNYSPTSTGNYTLSCQATDIVSTASSSWMNSSDLIITYPATAFSSLVTNETAIKPNTSDTIMLNFSAYDGDLIQNCSFWNNDTGSWVRNSTMTFKDNYATDNFETAIIGYNSSYWTGSSGTSIETTIKHDGSQSLKHSGLSANLYKNFARTKTEYTTYEIWNYATEANKRSGLKINLYSWSSYDSLEVGIFPAISTTKYVVMQVVSPIDIVLNQWVGYRVVTYTNDTSFYYINTAGTWVFAGAVSNDGYGVLSFQTYSDSAASYFDSFVFNESGTNPTTNQNNINLSVLWNVSIQPTIPNILAKGFWNVSCVDEWGNVSASTLQSYTVKNYSAPIVNYTFINSSAFYLADNPVLTGKCSANDTNSTAILNYNFRWYKNQSTYVSGSDWSGHTQGTVVTGTYAPFQIANFTFSCQAIDTFSGFESAWVNSSELSITVGNTTFSSPTTNATSNRPLYTDDLNFSVAVHDGDLLVSCSSYENDTGAWIIDDTYTFVTPTSDGIPFFNHYVNINPTVLGYGYWFARCKDTYGNYTNSSYFNYTVKTKPNISFSVINSSVVSSGSNYTRLFQIGANYVCVYNNTNLTFFSTNVTSNNSLQCVALSANNYLCDKSLTGLWLQFPLVCDATNHTANFSFSFYPISAGTSFGEEGAHNITAFLNDSVNGLGNSYDVYQNNLVVDLNNPTANYWLNLTGGFYINETNNTLQCVDAVWSNLLYNFSFNNVNIWTGNETNATVVINETTIVDGINNASFVCCDAWGCRTNASDSTIIKLNLTLIDEHDGTIFDVRNITNVSVFINSNGTSYNFWLANVSTVYFTSGLSTALRFEFTYPTGAVVNRYVDVAMLLGNGRICADRSGVTLQPNYLVSTQFLPIMVKNVFANCISTAEYTRFAYGTKKMLKVELAPTRYYLYNLDPVTFFPTYTASLDGSLALEHDLDAINFANKTYNIGIVQDALTTSKVSDDTITIYYLNLAYDNTAASIAITNLDNYATIFSDTLPNPNNYTVVFNFSSFGLNATSLLKIEVTKTNSKGTSKVSVYANGSGQTGKIPTGVAFAISIMLIMFGLTFTSQKLSFSWFGIIMEFVAIIVLAFALMTWYSKMLMGIELIILVYTVLVLNYENQRTVT